MGMVLKPPQGFEELYQGVIGTTPIPFVSANLAGDFLATDDVAGKPGFDPNLARFAPVPLGASLLILIPQAIFVTGATTRIGEYTYALRWRLRALAGYTTPAENANNQHPYHLDNQQGAPSTPSPTARVIEPSYTSELVTPAAVGTNNRVLIATGEYGTSSQGIYNPASFAGSSDGDDLALGPNFYPPLLRPSLGDELSIVASKASGNWDFGSVAADGDAGFSNVFGTNVAGAAHPAYAGLGIFLLAMSRSTTP